MNQNNKQKMMNDLLKSGKIDQKAINDAKNGNTDKLLSSLSNEDKQKLLKVMSDQNAMNEILKSPQAQAIMKLFGGKNG